MRVINKTQWNTRNIMKLVHRVAQDEFDPGQIKRLIVHVDYRRSNGYAGHGRYGHSATRPRLEMWLHLWKDVVDVVELAHTIAHEFAHNKGMRHRDMMSGSRYGYGEGWRERYGYAKDFPIGRKPEKAKPTVDDKRQKDLAKARGMVVKRTRRHKLATTTLNKWQSRRRAIERRIRAAAPIPSAPSV